MFNKIKNLKYQTTNKSIKHSKLEIINVPISIGIQFILDDNQIPNILFI